ncbi:hypothetical protein QTP88_005635 [Uroleucon formosanum]
MSIFEIRIFKVDIGSDFFLLYNKNVFVVNYNLSLLICSINLSDAPDQVAFLYIIQRSVQCTHAFTYLEYFTQTSGPKTCMLNSNIEKFLNYSMHNSPVHPSYIMFRLNVSNNGLGKKTDKFAI